MYCTAQKLACEIRVFRKNKIVRSVARSIFFLNIFPLQSVICSFTKMSPNESSAEKSVLKPPSDVRGMAVLDRKKFQACVQVPCVYFPVEKMSKALKVLKPHLLKMPKLQPVIKENPEETKVLLNPFEYEKKFAYIRKTLNNLSLDDVKWTDVHLKYENWTSDDIFRAVLPKDTAGNVSSFSIVGHIIHLNLKLELLDFKYLIGQVLLDKHQPNIKTVVNKMDIIENTFRNFKIELLAGDESYEVLVKENNFKYAFNYEKVFWNPRLSAEHDRMASKVKSEDLVFDVFAGVGPFAVPMAKKKCMVHANDLNPDSYYWLCHNAKLNKVQTHLKAYNVDGKDFIRTIIKNGIIDYFNSETKIGDIHILMNLPAIGLTFLKYFDGLFSEVSDDIIKATPIVHCYFFKRKDEKTEDVIGVHLSKNVVEICETTVVRLVAPNKLMMRISYQIPKTILFSVNSCEPSAKRLKFEESTESFHHVESCLES